MSHLLKKSLMENFIFCAVCFVTKIGATDFEYLNVYLWQNLIDGSKHRTKLDS